MAQRDIEQEWSELDALGEEEVRKKVAQGKYGSNRIGIIQAWLSKKDREYLDKSSSIANSARIAAWTAALAAIISSVYSIVSIVMR